MCCARYALTIYKPTFGGTSADEIDPSKRARGTGGNSELLAQVGGNETLNCPNCPVPSFEYLMSNFNQGNNVVYTTDGKGNYAYYYSDGEIEYSKTSPGKMLLQDLSLLLLYELKGLSIFFKTFKAAKEGLNLTFGKTPLRMYDARLGRWLRTDPYYQHHSPYLAMSNNPISFIDPTGGRDENNNGINDMDELDADGNPIVILPEFTIVAYIDVSEFFSSENWGLWQLEQSRYGWTTKDIKEEDINRAITNTSLRNYSVKDRLTDNSCDACQ